MFIQRDKTILTLDHRPQGVAGWLVSLDLAQKITAAYPYFDFVIDDNGELIDITPTTPLVPDIESIRAAKLSELSTACNTAITAGCDVTLTDGTVEHFSLQETDQINLSTAVAACEQGATAYPYHADGQLCRLYPAADIVAIGTAVTKHKLYHTTYCNHVMTWARRVETVDELQGITYGAALPEDLAANMEAVLGNAGS